MLAAIHLLGDRDPNRRTGSGVISFLSSCVCTVIVFLLVRKKKKKVGGGGGGGTPKMCILFCSSVKKSVVFNRSVVLAFFFFFFFYEKKRKKFLKDVSAGLAYGHSVTGSSTAERTTTRRTNTAGFLFVILCKGNKK